MCPSTACRVHTDTAVPPLALPPRRGQPPTRTRHTTYGWSYLVRVSSHVRLLHTTTTRPRATLIFTESNRGRKGQTDIGVSATLGRCVEDLVLRACYLCSGGLCEMNKGPILPC